MNIKQGSWVKYKKNIEIVGCEWWDVGTHRGEGAGCRIGGSRGLSASRNDASETLT
jgi:hypothetical protein